VCNFSLFLCFETVRHHDAKPKLHQALACRLNRCTRVFNWPAGFLAGAAGFWTARVEFAIPASMDAVTLAETFAILITSVHLLVFNRNSDQYYEN